MLSQHTKFNITHTACRTSLAKLANLQQAVSQNLTNGDTVAFEGFTHLIPYAAAHEAIRQGYINLTLIRITPEVAYDQMIGMGMVKKTRLRLCRQPKRRRPNLRHISQLSRRRLSRGQPQHKIQHLPLHKRKTSRRPRANPRCLIHLRPKSR